MMDFRIISEFSDFQTEFYMAPSSSAERTKSIFKRILTPSSVLAIPKTKFISMVEPKDGAGSISWA
jgi:hypothetical protein